MIPQTRAELLKIHSTRTTLGLAMAMVALVLLLVLLIGTLSRISQLTGEDDQRNLFGVGALATTFAALAGVLVVTGEYRFGTIRPTFLFTPRRSRVILAKGAAGALAGIALGAAAQGLALGLGYGILAGRGISLSLRGGDLALLALGNVAGAALWAGIGVGLGAIVRNQVGSVIGLLAWTFIIENLLFGLAPSVGRFAPTQAEQALTGMTTDHLLPPAAGAVVLAAWTAVLVAGGVALTARRDVG